ncbi:MAG: exodeoxyribonuclease III, partial [Patescibacteria group bacterium]
RTAARKRNVGWRIDYFFVNKEFLSSVKSARILADVEGSDHCPVELVLAL